MQHRTRTIVLGIVAAIACAGVAVGYQLYRGFGKTVVSIFRPPAIDVVEIIDAGDEPLVAPEGFRVGIFADNVPGARDLEPVAGGTLVSLPKEGSVLFLKDTNGDGRADMRVVVLENLDQPHGLQVRCADDTCELYVAETGMVSRYEYDANLAKATERTELLALPKGGRHWSRSLLLAPAKFGNLLLVSIGSSCNVCRETDDRRGTIMALDLATPSKVSTFARGLRNAVFLTEHPTTNDVWVTEMGRDMLGDKLPPDEVNVISEAGQHFGWPTCYGQNVHDTNFDTNTYIRNPCMEPFEKAATIDLPAHVAPLGLGFVPADGWPAEYQGSLLVAEHGSWNSTVPVGYKIVRYIFDGQGRTASAEDFLTGWLLPDGGLVGRPVDVAFLSGGVLLVSDDKAGVVYRVAQGGPDVRRMPVTEAVRVSTPEVGSRVTVPITVLGGAIPEWYANDEFTITVLSSDGAELGSTIAKAQGAVGADGLIAFAASMRSLKEYTGPIKLVLRRGEGVEELRLQLTLVE